jgi:hypothetical protein
MLKDAQGLQQTQLQKQKIIALNVAEKPSVAKAIGDMLCRSKQGLRKFNSCAQYNPVFEFYYHIRK